MSALDEALNAIDAERAELQLRLDELAEAAGVLRRLLGGVEPVVPARVPAGAPVAAPKPRPTPVKGPPAEGDLIYPECGQGCATANGLGVHRKRKHGVARDSAAYQRERKARLRGEVAPAPQPARVTPINVNGAPLHAHELGLRCDDCGYVVPVDRQAMLTTHCVTTHKRDATRAERTPRRAADLTPAEAS